jgi:hypothetical protein
MFNYVAGGSISNTENTCVNISLTVELHEYYHLA